LPSAYLPLLRALPIWLQAFKRWLEEIANRERAMSERVGIESSETPRHANMTLHDLPGHGDKLDIMRHFSEACRADLKR
jgi:hypothetical protein